MLLRNLFEENSPFDDNTDELERLLQTTQEKVRRKYRPLQPGDKRSLQIRIADLQEKYDELKEYERNLFAFMHGSLPPEILDDLRALEQEYKAIIARDTLALKSSVQDTKVYKLLAGIKVKCSEAVQAMQLADTLLYRGTSSRGDVYIGKPHTERRTMTSSSVAQDVYDKTIAKAGFKALRSNSIFTSGDSSLAFGFGSSRYIIFPVNGFNFTWSHSKRDIVIGSDELKNWYNRELVEKIWDQVFLNPENKRYFLIQTENIAEDSEVPENWIPYGLERESVLSYDGFMGGSSSGREHFKILHQMEQEGMITGVPKDQAGLVDPNRVVQSMDISHEDFVEALKSGNEICINGTYYAVAYKHVKLVQDYFKVGDYEKSEDEDNDYDKDPDNDY